MWTIEFLLCPAWRGRDGCPLGASALGIALGNHAKGAHTRLARRRAVPHAIEISTRAVTIAAPLETVWSWLVQIGQDRAGFYSYTWLENLFRCAMPRVDRIVPEWQQRTLGDIVWLARRDRYRGEARQKVVRIDRGRVLSLASPSDWGRLVQA